MTRYARHYTGFHGGRRPDGSVEGYSYASRQWVDTSPTAKRDPHYPAGSQRNPLAHIPDGQPYEHIISIHA